MGSMYASNKRLVAQKLPGSGQSYVINITNTLITTLQKVLGARAILVRVYNADGADSINVTAAHTFSGADDGAGNLARVDGPGGNCQGVEGRRYIVYDDLSGGTNGRRSLILSDKMRINSFNGGVGSINANFDFWALFEEIDLPSQVWGNSLS